MVLRACQDQDPQPLPYSLDPWLAIFNETLQRQQLHGSAANSNFYLVARFTRRPSRLDAAIGRLMFPAAAAMHLQANASNLELVMHQTGASSECAQAALRKNNDDIVSAIVMLTN